MDEVTKCSLANSLITQNIISYLIKTGVVDEDDYVGYTERLKHAVIENFERADGENKELSKEIITDIFDAHLEFTKEAK